jgi:lysine biosynthesis protein LysW
MAQGFCPECESKLNLGREPKEGQRVTCASCGSYLMVVGLSPIELDWAFDDEEEFDLYEEFEDEV